MGKECKNVVNRGYVAKQMIVNIENMNGDVLGAAQTRTIDSFFRDLFAYLESKRVLYYGCESESPKHCTESVLEVKRDLKDRIQRCGLNDLELQPIKAMLNACNAYLDVIDNQRNCGSICTLKVALVALRDGFKSAIKDVEADYGLKFRYEILPPCSL